ncbi:MAG: four helix bundle protein [Magnetococcus sp. YQC-5]
MGHWKSWDSISISLTLDNKAEHAGANQRLEKIRVLLRLCHEERFMSHDSFEFAIRSVDETGRMLGGWLKQQEGKHDARL